MANATKWYVNKGPYGVLYGSSEYPAKQLIKKTLDDASAEYVWLAAQATASKFTVYADDEGCPVDGDGARIDQSPYLTVEQERENHKGLIKKYQALLIEYSDLYAAADTAEVDVTSFSAPTEYNLSYFPVAEDPAE